MNTRTTAWFALLCLLGCGEATSADLQTAVGGTEFVSHDSDSAALSNATLSSNTLAFATDLYGVLGQGTGNLVYSPHAVALALGTVALGAGGETAQQLKNALHWDVAADELPARLATWRQALVRSAAASPNTTVDLATAVWGVPGVEPSSNYRNALGLAFGTQWFTLDMGAPDIAVARINDWVAQATRGAIPRLLSPGQLDPASRFLATSALYMAAPWQKPFSTAAVRNKAFYSANGEAPTVPTMSQLVGAEYGETDTFQALDLAYEGGGIHFTVLLPTQGAVPKHLSALAVRQALDTLQPHQVNVALPKFSVKGSYNLRETLQALGVRAAFAPGADFSAIDAGSGLVLDDVVHQTTVDVNEAGTHAAAATTITMRPTAVMAGTATMDVDRPFLFLVRDTNSGAVLFLGRVAHL